MSIPFEPKANYGVEDLLSIMELLRAKDGCPWDREQDHHSIRKNFLEETYEVLEAIDLADAALLKEELGDVLLQIVFHARMEEEIGGFCFSDVCDGICKKLIVRHPHVFAQTTVSGTDEVLSNWDKIKQETKGQTTAAQTLASVPSVFPALMRSEKVQSRAAKAGFDYLDVDWAMRDLESEVVELKQAMTNGVPREIEEELGDLLFSAVNVARFVKVDAEQSLAKSCEKFIARFEKVEQQASAQGIDMKSASIEELDRLWKKAKLSVGCIANVRL